MELLLLDKDFNNLGQIAPTSIQWNRKYYEAGDFMVMIDTAQYNPNACYLYTNERPELGVISKVEYQVDKVATIQISGNFAEKILDDSVIYPTFYGNGPCGATCKTMVQQYAGMDVVAEGAIPVGKVTFQETGAKLGSKIYEILSQFGCGYRVVYDFPKNLMKFETYQGKDRSQDNSSGENFITFSVTWDNLSDVSVIVDASDFKNYAIVGGQGEGENRTYQIVDNSKGERKKMVFVDSRNSQFDEKKQTWQEYLDGLKQEGLEALEQHKRIENIDFFPIVGGYEYLNDYDLGDLCDAVVEPLDLQIKGRIIEVHEVFEKGIHSIELELGDRIISKINKIERKLII